MYNIDCKYNTYTNLSLITSLDSLTIFFYYQESSNIILILLKNYDPRGEFRHISKCKNYRELCRQEAALLVEGIDQ